MTNKNKINFVDFVDLLKEVQELLKQENLDRVSNTPDTEWDLIQQLIITPSMFVIKSDSIIIELDSDLKITGRIKKRRKK